MSPAPVRDPIHGFIELSAAEWRAVDTRVFQRLRLVRQLALTYLVYPGTMHTRFEHSLGVAHIASRLTVGLGLSGDDASVVRVAALMHDVGHGVFSHVSEQVIDERSGAEGVHESVSEYILRADSEIRGALGEKICDRAADLIGLRGPRSVMRDIVSGPSDADKLDYLLRDSYFAGVNYGRFDLDRVIGSVRTIAPDSVQTQMGFDIGGLWAVEELLLARHHMHRQVYGHKTRLATDIMVTRALRLAVDREVLPRTAYEVDVRDGKPQISEEFLEGYLAQTDVRVLDQMAGSGDPEVADLGQRLLRRDLLRQSASIRLDPDTSGLGYPLVARIRDPDEFTRDVIGAMEISIADQLGVPVHLVGIYVDSRANPTYRNPAHSIGVKDIMVQRGEEAPNLFHRESQVFQDELGPDDPWIYLYTPLLDEPKRAHEALWNELQNL